MELKIVKTNLGTLNGGICGSRNNARYRGTTPVWVLEEPDGLVVYQSKTRTEAEEAQAVAQKYGWDGRGCLEVFYDNRRTAFRKFKGGDVFYDDRVGDYADEPKGVINSHVGADGTRYFRFVDFQGFQHVRNIDLVGKKKAREYLEADLEFYKSRGWA